MTCEDAHIKTFSENISKKEKEVVSQFTSFLGLLVKGGMTHLGRHMFNVTKANILKGRANKRLGGV